MSKTELTKKWNDICLDMQQLDELIWVDFDNKTDIEWEQFLALGCSALAGVGCARESKCCLLLSSNLAPLCAITQNITQALVQLTKILGANDDDRIPLDVFERNYRYLAKIDGDIKDAQLQEVLDFLSDPGYVRCGLADSHIARRIAHLLQIDVPSPLPRLHLFAGMAHRVAWCTQTTFSGPSARSSATDSSQSQPQHSKTRSFTINVSRGDIGERAWGAPTAVGRRSIT